MMKRIVSATLLIIIFNSVFSQETFTGEGCIIRNEFIYQPGDVNFPGCHASTIIETKDGLMASWFGGTAEKNPDVGIWTSHYSAGKWSIPKEVANGVQYQSKRYPCWNPVLYNTGKDILLFFKVGPSPSTWWGEMISSSDNGNTWSRPYRLPEDIYGPIKNKPVLLKNGELLCPSSTEHDGWRVHFETTSDMGLHWERTPAINDKTIAAIQPTILLHGDGSIQMLCRSKSSVILSSFSKDNGRTWSGLGTTGLPNPNSGIDAVTMSDGRFIMVYNHQVKGRNLLNVAISEDGLNWKAAAELENGPQRSEFSYPAVIQSSDGLIHITYTWNRKQIKHVVINPALIKAKPFSNGEWPQ